MEKTVIRTSDQNLKTHHRESNTLKRKRNQTIKPVKAKQKTIYAGAHPKHLKGIRIEVMLDDGTKNDKLAWYNGLVTQTYDEFTVQWKCDDGEVIDHLNLERAQWKVLPMTSEKHGQLMRRIIAMGRKRKLPYMVSPRKSRKHWHHQLMNTDLISIKNHYRNAVQRSRDSEIRTNCIDPTDTKRIKREQDREKQIRIRELDRGNDSTGSTT
jgi:anaerobic selenocysteine-containing dehydrogenase